MFKRTLDAMVPTPDLHRLEQFDDLLQQIARMEEGLARLEQVQRMNEQLRKLKLREIEQVISEAGVCPFCGHMMDVAHFLEGVHAGSAFVRSGSGPL
jgi:DNA repair exonuclease SbcCD ATPase subunit